MPEHEHGQLVSGQEVNGILRRVGSPLWLVLALALAPGPALGADVPALVLARQLYNRGQFAEAAKAALPARASPATRDAADLVIGRARLELFRQTAADADLAAAREALGAVRPQELPPRDRVELLTGLGTVLFLENAFGAAASIFEVALAAPDGPDGAAREWLFDWWASAVDRHAQVHPPEARLDLYLRIVEAAEAEMRRPRVTAAAIYWQAAALVARGDADGAYQAAQAGWVRAPFNPDQAASLRTDLDRLVRDGVIPDRVRRIADVDPEHAAESLRAEWTRFKSSWAPKQ